MKELGLTRVHATIRADFHNAEKWIKIVGFEKEGVMRNYGPDGEDHILFAKVVI
jgi:RimJ/RimL family protein N-acetyltransferase